MYALSRINEYVIMAWDALRSHKLRSLLTTLGILIGVTTIIAIWTTIQGLNDYVYGQLSNIGGNTIFVEKWPWVIQGDFWKYRNRKDVTYREYEAIKKHSTLAYKIAPQVFSPKKVSYKNESFDNIFIIGSTEDYSETANVFPATGRFLTELDVRNNRMVCVLGDEVAKRLFKDENPLERKIKIDGQRYQVIGILERKGNFFGQNMDDFVVVPFGTFRNVTSGHMRGMRISVMTDNPAKLEDLKDEIRGIMRTVRRTPPAEDDDFSINQQDVLTDFYRQMTGTLYLIVFIIGGISLLVGGIGIMNIMLVSVTERTREIGIRKAIGANRRNVLSQFLIEAITISSFGGFIGIILGYAAGTVILSQMDLTTGVSIVSIVIGFGFSTLVGVSAGFYPAFKASRLNPIESLRYE